MTWNGSKKLPEYLLLVAAIAIGYYLLGRFGLSLAFAYRSVSPIWPPTGFSLAVLVLGGYRFWPGILIGAFFTNMTIQGSVVPCMAIALGNTLEALMGAYLCNRFAAGRQAFRKSNTTLCFIFLVCMASTAISATVGTTALLLAKDVVWMSYGDVWFTWWMGDLVSNLVIGSLLLIWFRRPLRAPETRREPIEFVGLWTLIFVAAQIIFGAWPIFPAGHYPIGHLSIPLLICATFRLGQRGSALAMFTVAGIAAWNTVHGNGPFVREDVNTSLLLVQLFMAVASSTMLVLSSVLFERRQGQLQLQEFTRKLKNSNTELEQFAAVASHDLQEPLRKIRIFSDFLWANERERLSDQGREYVRKIQDATDRMRILTEDLLNYSCLNREDQIKEVNLNTILKDVRQDLEMTIRETAAQIEACALPSVLAGEVHMRQLFQNLIGNAIKFSKKGVAPVIRITCNVQERFVAISVADEGIGFDDKYSKLIFEPFKRLHGHEKYAGSGIGLAVCRKIVEQYGGAISASSRPGAGTAFLFTLPVSAGK